MRKSRKTILSPQGNKILRGCDIFSGCGGITLGLHEACAASGHQLQMVMACDMFPAAKISYEANFRPNHFLDHPIEQSVDGKIGESRTPIEEQLIKKLGVIDVVVGGPPCQGNSNLNNHTRGDDPRNELYMRMVRFVELFKPMIVLIENVRGVTKNKQKVVVRANDYLRSIGYSVDHGVVKGHHIGIPQTRARHFTVAVLNEDVDVSFEQFSKPTTIIPRTLRWAIDDLQGKKPPSDSLFYHTPNPKIINQARMDFFKDSDLYNLPNCERPPCQQKDDHTYPAVYGRMYWDKPAPTLTTGFGCNGRGRFTHPEGGRVLTPHEAARVQTFPDYFDLTMIEKRTDLHYLIGNAVPPLMAKHILKKLIDISFDNKTVD